MDPARAADAFLKLLRESIYLSLRRISHFASISGSQKG